MLLVFCLITFPILDNWYKRLSYPLLDITLSLPCRNVYFYMNKGIIFHMKWFPHIQAEFTHDTDFVLTPGNLSSFILSHSFLLCFDILNIQETKSKIFSRCLLTKLWTPGKDFTKTRGKTRGKPGKDSGERIWHVGGQIEDRGELPSEQKVEWCELYLGKQAGNLCRPSKSIRK